MDRLEVESKELMSLINQVITLTAEVESLRAELIRYNTQLANRDKLDVPCGHGVWIVTTGEGTNYCGWCALISEVQSLRAQLKLWHDTMGGYITKGGRQFGLSDDPAVASRMILHFIENLEKELAETHKLWQESCADAFEKSKQLAQAREALVAVMESEGSKIIIRTEPDGRRTIYSCPACGLCIGRTEHYIECYFYNVKAALGGRK